MSKKVVVGMSGGVDSSVCALLLKKAGYEVIGATMRFWQADDQLGEAEDARRVAEVLDIPHYVFDFRNEFQKSVKDYFTEEYLQGRTPNPCVVCNRKVKWETLLAKSRELGAELIATGHYARIDKLENGRYTVANSVTAAKDQTYALYNLTQDQLARTLMPIGEFPKDEVRRMAEEAGLPVAHKKDSMEICFIPDKDYAGFIRRTCPDRMPGEGNFVDKNGKILGRHKGIIHYTIGQRKGLDLPMGHPVYVTGIRPDTNEVVVGENEELFTTELVCSKVNYMAMADLTEPRRALVKIRYGHKGTFATLEKAGQDGIRCTFEEPVRAVTPGQAVVFYDNGCVLGGGIIEN